MKNRHERRKDRALGNDSRLQGMDIRYGGRTIEFRIYVNTNDALTALADRIKGAARGPKLAMATVAGGEMPVPEAHKLWELAIAESCTHVPRCSSDRYDGRTMNLLVLVNTDEPLDDVVARVTQAARARGEHIVLTASDHEDASEVWAQVFEAAEQTVERESNQR